MNDRELLELAAKAAGMTGWRYAGVLGMCKMINQSRPDATGSIGLNWNPLTYDDDALCLAVKLRLRLNREISFGEDIVEAFGPEDDSMSCHCSTESTNGDPYAATRRAIVRVAAEIGRQMREGGAA